MGRLVFGGLEEETAALGRSRVEQVSTAYLAISAPWTAQYLQYSVAIAFVCHCARMKSDSAENLLVMRDREVYFVPAHEGAFICRQTTRPGRPTSKFCCRAEKTCGSPSESRNQSQKIRVKKSESKNQSQKKATGAFPSGYKKIAQNVRCELRHDFALM